MSRKSKLWAAQLDYWPESVYMKPHQVARMIHHVEDEQIGARMAYVALSTLYHKKGIWYLTAATNGLLGFRFGVGDSEYISIGNPEFWSTTVKE